MVARRVWRACREGDTRSLDARGRIATVFVFQAIRNAVTLDPAGATIPVTPARISIWAKHGFNVETRHCGTVCAVGESGCNWRAWGRRLAGNSLLKGWCAGAKAGQLLRDMQPPGTAEGHYQVLRRKPSLDAAGCCALRDLMMQTMGPVRSGAAMHAALADCAAMDGWQGTLAQMMLQAAIARQQSLGAHYRVD